MCPVGFAPGVREGIRSVCFQQLKPEKVGPAVVPADSTQGGSSDQGGGMCVWTCAELGGPWSHAGSCHSSLTHQTWRGRPWD